MKLFNLSLLVTGLALSACNDGVIAFENASGLSVAPLEQNDINTAQAVTPLWTGYPRGQNDRFHYGLSSNALEVGACRGTSGRDAARMEVRGFMVAGARQFSYTQTQLARAIDAFPGVGTNYSDLVKDGRRSRPADHYFLCYFAGAGSGNDRMIFYISLVSIAESLPMDIAVEFDMLSGDLSDVELFQRGSLPRRVQVQGVPQNGNVLEVISGKLHVNSQPVLFNGSDIPARTAAGQFD